MFLTYIYKSDIYMCQSHICEKHLSLVWGSMSVDTSSNVIIDNYNYTWRM